MNPLVLLPLLWCACAPAPAPRDDSAVRVEREAWVMGTVLRIVVESEDRQQGAALAEGVLREVERIDRLLSTWDPESPLSRVNRGVPDQWIETDPEVVELVHEAVRWSERTERAFEPRVGALIDAWDLHGAGRVPGESELREGLKAVGALGVQLDGGRLKRAPSAWIDAGAFGKGAALRSAARRVAPRSGPPAGRLLADLGGQLLVISPPGRPWPVDVADPVERSRPAVRLLVQAGSVATSGTSERGRHILDPRTGRAVEPWGSVTVVHEDPFAADALSTALFVLGPDEGPLWAERHGVAALFLEVAGSGVTAGWTPHLAPLVVELAESITGTTTQLNSRKR